LVIETSLYYEARSEKYQNYFCSSIYCYKVLQQGEKNKRDFPLFPSLIWLLRW